MANVLHKNLTTTDLHEPKGADAASAYEVYIADGAGSGTWFVLRPIGEIIDCMDITEPAGFLFCDGDTLGNASSNATARANADTVDLFNKLWAVGDTYATLVINDSAGSPSTYGASAAADYAANKAIALPDLRERVSAGWDNKGNVTRLATTVVGDSIGAVGGIEAFTILQTHLPALNFSNSLTAASHTHTVSVTGSTSISLPIINGTTPIGGTLTTLVTGGTTGAFAGTCTASGTTAASGSLAVSGTVSSGGGDTALPIAQPTFICTKLIFYGA